METAALVREYRLPREALQPEHLTSPEVWEALLEDMPMTALIRNLATMTRVGVLAPGSDGTATAVAQLGDAERIRRARVHPIAVLAALRTYASGRGARGRGEWNPVREVVDALDAAFYTAFGNVEPTGKRLLLALDVSGSMTWGRVAGVPGLTPRDASAALALVTAATEERYEIVGFMHRLDAARDLAAAAAGRRRPRRCPTCRSAAPTARCRCCTRRKRKREIDTFVIYTDSETWAGTSTRPRRSATTATRRASTRGWSWSAWSRTASRSPIPQTRGCSTSSASTRRRRSSSPTSPAALSDSEGAAGRPSTRREEARCIGICTWSWPGRSPS